MRLLIAGCGYVGTALAAELAGRHEVFGLRRRWKAPPADLTPLEADLEDPGSLRRLPSGLDAVVYAVSPGERSDDAYRRAFVDGLRRLQDELARSSPGLARFLFVSSTAVYAQTDGEFVDEESPTEPEHFSGRRLLEGEALVGEGPGQGACLRFGGIYGPGRTGLLERVRRGEAFHPPGPPRYSNRIHRDDTAGSLAHLLAVPALPSVVLGVDHAPAELREVQLWLAERLGAPTPEARAPRPGSRMAAGNRRCCNDRLVALGYRFRFPSYREGYADLLR